MGANLSSPGQLRWPTARAGSEMLGGRRRPLPLQARALNVRSNEPDRMHASTLVTRDTAHAFSALRMEIGTGTVSLARDRLDHGRGSSRRRSPWLPSVVEDCVPTLCLFGIAEGMDAQREEVHVSVCVHIYGYHRSRSRLR